jgi:hypothetical protein
MSFANPEPCSQCNCAHLMINPVSFQAIQKKKVLLTALTEIKAVKSLCLRPFTATSWAEKTRPHTTKKMSGIKVPNILPVDNGANGDCSKSLLVQVTCLRLNHFSSGTT